MKNSAAYPHLMQAGLLHGLPDEQKRAFLDSCIQKYCNERITLLTQSEPTQGCYLIARGRVEISYLDEDGNVSILHVAGTGEVIGEVEAISETPCAASCFSLPDTTVLYCPAAVLLDYAKNPAVIRNFAAILHDRLMRDNHRRAVEQFHTVDKRLFSYLCQFSTPDDPEIRFSQAHLATLMGCSRQKVNRMLKVLRDDGMIDLRRGRIVILDRAKVEGKAALRD
ncbi:Crp/Fnr family transcriptional regulator [Salipiger sp. P9]|uniref:Crp/Fnr family transcriptional regulator n=1 Tax=Salipiger pentaromativorans TaxID=2943193 RepID=UPI00215884F9|nr:Crp/Fnr family transcriptional regulator [Salipiger pentaromativorans]MCR8550800.1 Crp/Fnr family transcriptional regulator [Salipiger pentaromativorans]